MINICFVEQYPITTAAYVHMERAQSQNEILISQIIQDPLWKFNLPVLEGYETKEDQNSIESNNQKEDKSSSLEQSEEQQSQIDSHSLSQESTEELNSEIVDEDQEKEEDDYQIAKPFTHSGAVILSKQEMNLKFENLPENAVLWIEENGEKRKVELNQNELSIALNEDLVKATIIDDQGKVLRKWSILCLEEEDSIKDLILDLEDHSDSAMSSQQDQSIQEESKQDEDTTQDDSNEASDASELNTSIESEQQTPAEDVQEQQDIQQDPGIDSTVVQEVPVEVSPKPDVWSPQQVDPNDMNQIQANVISSNDKKDEEINIKLSANQKIFDSGQKVYIENLANAKLLVNGGTITKTEVISQETKQVYSSLQDAAKAEQSGTFDVIATVLDHNLQEIKANWTVIQVGVSVATSTTTQGKKLDMVYQMDEQGKLQVQSQSYDQTIQLYRKFEPLTNSKIRSGEQLRLYLDKEPGTYQVQINGQKTEATIQKDELGQPYLPIEAKKGTNTIQLYKNGEEVFSQQIFANSSIHFKHYLFVAAGVLIAFAIALTIYKRRGQLCV